MGVSRPRRRFGATRDRSEGSLRSAATASGNAAACAVDGRQLRFTFPSVRRGETAEASRERDSEGECGRPAHSGGPAVWSGGCDARLRGDSVGPRPTAGGVCAAASHRTCGTGSNPLAGYLCWHGSERGPRLRRCERQALPDAIRRAFSRKRSRTRGQPGVVCDARAAAPAKHSACKGNSCSWCIWLRLE